MAEVSIILPVKNSEKYIKSTINSILNQTFKDFELIIIDDASTDNSLNLINELKNEKFVILKNEKNLGAALSRNKGIEKATGKYIVFIDSDDVWNKEKLEKQLKFMKEKNIAFSFTSYERVKENGEVIGAVDAPNEVDYNYMLKNVVIQVSTIIIDITKVKKELIYMPNMKTCEDVAMYLNILNTGVIAYGYPEYLTKYMVRKNSLSSKKALNTIRLWKTYKKYNMSFKDRCENIIDHAKNSIYRRMPQKKIKRIKEIFMLLSYKQILDIFCFPIVFIISLLYKPFLKNIWIIEENPNEACDNGYIFFKYLSINRKDLNVYYVINKKSKDYEKVKKIGNVIKHGSLKHWIYYLNAKKIIVTQKYANPSPAIFHILHKYGLIRISRIFLRHGIAKDDCKMFYYENTKFRLFICGARREYEYVKEHFGYPNENVVYTGFARFDNLNISNEVKNKMILVCPTWRKWIKTQKEFDAFMEHYYILLNNKELISFLEKKNIILNFVMHKNMKKFKLNEITKSKNIIINHNEDIDIQSLINKADLFITDYSSIFMDMAYRKVPIIYYQFDKTKFRKQHLQKGYFSYEEDGFGDVLVNLDSVIEKIKYYINKDFEVEEKYLNKMDIFFERKDRNNCKRILEAIEKI